jgi:hypothetical protein
VPGQVTSPGAAPLDPPAHQIAYSVGLPAE